MFQRLFVLALAGSFLTAAPAQGQTAADGNAPAIDDAAARTALAPLGDDAAHTGPSAAAQLHAPFDTLLKAHVKDGIVDYAGLEGKIDALDGYLEGLAAVDPVTLDRPSQLAFWINAYNAFTLKLMLERYPKIESIRDIPSSQRWDDERWPVNGERVSLTAIEHEILRPLGDPRIHFAINCASKSCPDLRDEAYLPETLDAQLDDAARTFLTDSTKGLRTEIAAGFFGTDHDLYVSKIFSWFEEDFEAASGSVPDYVLPFVSDTDAAFITAHRDDLDVEFLDYDWSLNGH